MVRAYMLFAMLTLCVMAVPAGAEGSREELPHTTDTLEVVKERVQEKKAVLVDVRSIPEWNDGHVKDAVFLPWRDLQTTLKEKDIREKIPKDAIVYTYCAVGYRASRAGKILASYGFDVRPLKPGYDDLVKAGFVSEKKK